MGLSLVEIYLCLLVWAYFFSDRIIFQPPPPSYAEGPGVGRIPVTETESIALLSLPLPGAEFVLLHVHGNAEDLGGIRWVMEEFRGRGFEVVAFDYRGYGLSDGTPSTQRAYEDVEAVYHHLVRDRGLSPGRILVHGRSVGAAMALYLAERHPVGGLVVESAFLSAFRARTQISIAPFDKMNNARRMKNVRCPVLVIHGEQDRVIPFWQGKRLYELAPDPKQSLWVPGAGHDDVLLEAGESYWQAWSNFCSSLAGRK